MTNQSRRNRRPNHSPPTPRKRPTHTLSQGMLLRDGRPWIVHGSMGGEIQPQVYAQLVSAVVDAGADIATAVAAPRWAARMPGHLAPPTISQLEDRVAPGIVGGHRRCRSNQARALVQASAAEAGWKLGRSSQWKPCSASA